MLSKRYRLSASRHVMCAMRKGRSYTSHALVVKYLPNKLTHPRFAFIVSTKISKRAVVRNTIKRHLREAVRRYGVSRVPNVDIILIAKLPLVNTPFSRTYDEVVTQLNKCHLPFFSPKL